MVDETGIMQARATLRSTVRRMRGMAAPEDITRASQRAGEVLAAIRGIQRARTVLLHDPQPGDLDPLSLAPRLAERGVRVLVADPAADAPRVLAPGRFHLVDADDDPDAFAAVEVVVLPGVAFDLDGGRLGPEDDDWGRLVGRLDDGALRIGLARTAQLVPRVPRLAGDMLVDMVVTDRAAHHTGARLGPRDA